MDETEGITITTRFNLSTTKLNGPLWGVSLTIPVGKINDHGEYLIFKQPNDVLNEFKVYLEKICDPFPILKERLPQLKLNYHGDTSWENAIIYQHLNPKETIYFCDHCHK